MQFTTETREYLTCEILPLSYMKGWTYVRTIFSEIKFLGCIDNKIFLPMVLALRTSSARVKLIIIIALIIVIIIEIIAIIERNVVI